MNLKTEAQDKKSFQNFFWGFGIFFLAFFLRIVYLYQYRHSPFYESPIIDALSHYLFAQRMAAGDWLVKGVVAPRVPLYVYFLAAIFKIFGTGFTAPRVIQMLLGAFNCVLVYLLGKRVFSRSIGIIAAFIMSVYGVFIYFDAELLNVTLSIFFELVFIIAVLRTMEKPRTWKWFACGALFGIALQTSANVILFFPLLLIWIYKFNNKAADKLKKKLLPIVSVFLGTLLTLMPFALRNYFEGGEFMLLSSTAGINLYIGNNPYADGKTALAPSRDYSYSGWLDNVWVSSIKSAERTSGRDMRPSEISDFWMKRALNFIFTYPGRWFNLLVRKFYYFFNAYEIPENQSIYFFRVWSTLLQILVFSNSFFSFPFGIVCPPALLGIAVSLKREKSVILMNLFILSQLALMMIFFVVSRYRTAVLPYLFVFAGYAIVWIFKLLSQKRIGMFFFSSFILVAMFGFVNSNFFGVKQDDKSLWFLKLGTALHYKGELNRALKSLKQAQKISPENVDAIYNIGVIYLEKGENDKAIEKFNESLKLDPNDSAAYANIGIALSKQGKFEQAIQYYQKSLELDPEDVGTMANLGAAYLNEENFLKALKVLQQAGNMNENFAPVHNHLGVAYERLKRYDEAEAEYKLAVKLDPGYLEGYYNLAGFYKRQGFEDRAKQINIKIMELLSEGLKPHR